MQEGQVMTTFEISAPRLSDAEQRVQLRRAVVAGTVRGSNAQYARALI